MNHPHEETWSLEIEMEHENAKLKEEIIRLKNVIRHAYDDIYTMTILGDEIFSWDNGS